MSSARRPRATSSGRTCPSSPATTASAAGPSRCRSTRPTTPPAAQCGRAGSSRCRGRRDRRTSRPRCCTCCPSRGRPVMRARRPAPSAWPGRSVGWPTTTSASASSHPWWTRTTPPPSAGRSSSPRSRADPTSGRTCAVPSRRATAPSASPGRSGSARWPTPASSSSPPGSTAPPPGPGGSAASCVPREVDGAPNGFALRRLKDKLGTRGLASGEIDFDGARGVARRAPSSTASGRRWASSSTPAAG